MDNLPSRVQQAIELQQTAIAGEIHDSLLPLLFASRMRLELLLSRITDWSTIEELKKSIAGIQEAMEVGRQLIGDLYPPDLEQTSWRQQLAETLDRADSSHSTQLIIEGDLDRLIAYRDGQVSARRIAQEAIRNAVRHGKAKTITVSAIAPSDHQVELSIHDDGQGFTPEKVTRGCGLRLMQSRATLMNASLNVDSKPGGPTRVTLLVGLQEGAVLG